MINNIEETDFIEKKNEEYHLLYHGKEYYICKVNELNRYYLDDMADVLISRIEREEKMAAWK